MKCVKDGCYSDAIEGKWLCPSHEWDKWHPEASKKDYRPPGSPPLRKDPYDSLNKVPMFGILFVILFGIEAMLGLMGVIATKSPDPWGPVLLQGVVCGLAVFWYITRKPY